MSWRRFNAIALFLIKVPSCRAASPRSTLRVIMEGLRRLAAASCWLLTRRLRTRAPTDRNEPLLIVVLEPFTVGRQRLRFCASKSFSERFETHRTASFIHSLRILDRGGPHVAVLIGLELRAVELRATFEYTDPVF